MTNSLLAPFSMTINIHIRTEPVFPHGPQHVIHGNQQLGILKSILFEKEEVCRPLKTRLHSLLKKCWEYKRSSEIKAKR